MPLREIIDTLTEGLVSAKIQGDTKFIGATAYGHRKASQSFGPD